MAIWNRKSAVAAALTGWKERGLIDGTTFERLSADLQTQAPARSFTAIILLLGVICIAFGVMTFVAANWDQMSNLFRVGLLFAALWASWGLSVWLKMRGHSWAAQLFVLLACAIFGASIMLIGQIYQIQGKPKDAVWLWAVGTFVAAFLTRSVPALALAVMAITVWALMDFNLFGREDGFEYGFLAYWLAGAAGAWWMASRFTAHILMLSLSTWLLFLVFHLGEMMASGANLTPLFAVLFITFALISLALYSLGDRQWFKGFEPAAIVHLFLLAGALVFFWYMATDMRWNGDWRSVSAASWPGLVGLVVTGILAGLGYQQKNTQRYDLAVTVVFTALAAALSLALQRVPFLMEGYMLALSIWVIRMGWRLEYRSLSTLGFLTFTGVMLLLYFETLGNLLDTSLFYLGAGIVLLAGAIIIPKLARRTRKAGEAAS